MLLGKGVILVINESQNWRLFDLLNACMKNVFVNQILLHVCPLESIYATLLEGI